jgi:hypothetical protein
MSTHAARGLPTTSLPLAPVARHERVQPMRVLEPVAVPAEIRAGVEGS